MASSDESLQVGTHAETNARMLSFPNCQHDIRSGELVCPQCNTAITTIGRTHQIDIKSMPKKWSKGDVFASGTNCIYLEIAGAKVNLPDQDYLTIGRVGTIYGQEPPDVDLSHLGAELHGVSRLHLRLVRRDSLLLIADIGSTNGTHFNGRRLVPYAEHILRDGDELELGKLKMIIRFR